MEIKKTSSSNNTYYINDQRNLQNFHNNSKDYSLVADTRTTIADITNKNINNQRNNDSNNSINHSQAELEPYLICVDPDTQQIYTMGLLNFHIRIEKDIPTIIKEKVKQNIKNLLYLRDGSKFKWWFKSQAAIAYRRRKLPSYLLHQDIKSYPIYQCGSNLSLAFSEVHSIILNIDLQEYADMIAREGAENNSVCPLNITINAGLVTGADEVIKNLLRHIYKKYFIPLRPKKNDHKFVLKVYGFREYFMGGFPLLSYDRVRSSLRGLRSLKLILTEILTNRVSENYPPVIYRDINNVRKGIFDPIDWSKFVHIPLVLWYPPQELSNYKSNRESLVQSLNSSKKLSDSKQKIPRILEPITKAICQPDFKKKKKEDFEYSSNIKEKIFTGELDILFRLRILGIENLLMIIEQIENGATDCGVIIPPYVTKIVNNKESEENHGHAGGKAKKSKKKKGNALHIPKLAKKKNDKDPNVAISSGNNNDYLYQVDHGKNAGEYIEIMKNEDLSFVPYFLTIEVTIYHGCNILRKSLIVETKTVPFCYNPRWMQWLDFQGILLSELPKEARLGFNVKMWGSSGENMIIACATYNLFDMFGHMNRGIVELNLYPFYKIDPRLACSGEFWMMKNLPNNVSEEEQLNIRSKEFARLVIQFDTFENPVYWSLRDSQAMLSKGYLPISSRQNILKRVPQTEELAILQTLLNRDPLNWDFDDSERDILLVCRHHYRTLSWALPIFLAAIDWSCPDEVNEAHLMLLMWERMDPAEAICLLDARFADSRVRLYAVERISELPDDDLLLYLLQLVQALVYETQHHNPLGELLLERALANPYLIGHELFWLLRSQLHVKPTYERITLILEQFIMLCGSFRQDLHDEILVNSSIVEIAEKMPKISKDSRAEAAAKELAELNEVLPSEFAFSLDARMRARKFIPKSCKAKDSKKVPLWLVCENAQKDSPNILVLFKVGDDLRQDYLTIQLIKIMDKIWLDNGLDLRMKPYKVLSTADQVGIIEIVQNSDTTSNIHKQYGGSIGALSKESLLWFLEKQIQDPNDPNERDNIIENFIRSCAGYCVATYILGIGDRHSDNIMLSKYGHLFHIDFGHFLGNFKTKFGFKRERTPFVFTEEMAHVMGGRKGEGFERFCQFCTQAFNLVRKKGNHLISLFILMLSAGMPELMAHSDIDYLKNQLSLSLSEQEANNKFRAEIINTLNNAYRKFDNFIHAIKRG